MQNFRALGAPPPDPRASGGLGLCPQTPRPPLASGGWGLRPQTPQTAPPWRISGYAPAHNLIHNVNSIIKGINHYSAAVHESITLEITAVSTQDKLQLQDFNCE